MFDYLKNFPSSKDIGEQPTAAGMHEKVVVDVGTTLQPITSSPSIVLDTPVQDDLAKYLTPLKVVVKKYRLKK